MNLSNAYFHSDHWQCWPQPLSFCLLHQLWTDSGSNVHWTGIMHCVPCLCCNMVWVSSQENKSEGASRGGCTMGDTDAVYQMHCSLPTPKADFPCPTESGLFAIDHGCKRSGQCLSLSFPVHFIDWVDPPFTDDDGSATFEHCIGTPFSAQALSDALDPSESSHLTPPMVQPSLIHSHMLLQWMLICRPSWKWVNFSAREPCSVLVKNARSFFCRWVVRSKVITEWPMDPSCMIVCCLCRIIACIPDWRLSMACCTKSWYLWTRPVI